MFEKSFAHILAAARRLGLPYLATAPFCPSEVAGSVVTPSDAGFWKRLRLSLGPGLLVAVGYMDPGNWTTNLQGGAKLGGGLAAVVILSGLVAIGFQLLAARWAALDTGVTLSLAILVNLGLLVFAALAFHAHGLTDISDLHVATQSLAVGEPGGRATDVAATIFALGLLASGLSSTFTGTIVGQVVMEGFLELKIPCWLRRVITRGLALIPALVGVVWLGRDGVGDLLEASQVTLAALLPFALAPLIMLSGDSVLMGPLTAPRRTLVAAWVLFSVLVAANGVLVFA